MSFKHGLTYNEYNVEETDFARERSEHRERVLEFWTEFELRVERLEDKIFKLEEQLKLTQERLG